MVFKSWNLNADIIHDYYYTTTARATLSFVRTNPSIKSVGIVRKVNI